MVIDNYWSTVSGSTITSVALRFGKAAVPKPGVAGFALAGMDVRVVHDESEELKREIGEYCSLDAFERNWISDLFER